MNNFLLLISFVVFFLNFECGICNVELSYQKLRQKSSHNSYESYEGLIDQLQYHRIYSLELDIYVSVSYPGDWLVFHSPYLIPESSCTYLSDCLQELRAWHDANPDHEVVTMWIDIKESNTMTGSNSPQDFDYLINEYLNVFKPGDLLLYNSASSSSSLQSAVSSSSSNWPTTSDLRGKFIFVMTGKVDAYTTSSSDANTRSAFVSCHPNNNKDYCVFFNNECGDSYLCTSVYNNNHVCRCYYSDDSSSWSREVNNKVSHISTNKINFHRDSFAKTHNQYGWPFESIDSSYDVSNNIPINSFNNIVNIQVDSGDIWNKYDDFVFCYRTVYDTNKLNSWTVAVNGPSSHVETYVKAGLMIRSDISGSNSANNGEGSIYFAVLRLGDNRKLAVQWRTSHKGNSNSHEVDITSPDGSTGIDQENFSFIKLEYYYNSGHTYAYGYGSQDGKTYKLIKHVVFYNQQLKYQGIAGSSHNDGGNADGTKIKHLFTNLKLDGTRITANNLVKLNVGNDVSYSKLSNGFF